MSKGLDERTMEKVMHQMNDKRALEIIDESAGYVGSNVRSPSMLRETHEARSYLEYRIESLCNQEIIAQGALRLACERIADGPQEYNEAKSADDWAKYFIDSANATQQRNATAGEG